MSYRLLSWLTKHYLEFGVCILYCLTIALIASSILNLIPSHFIVFSYFILTFTHTCKCQNILYIYMANVMTQYCYTSVTVR